jgi:hypothetical protein
MLKELKASGKARADIDVEILTYITFGSIASTIMLGAQRKGEDLDTLSERFANEWNRILEKGIFVRKTRRDAGGKELRRKPRLLSKAAART